jgi:hypothetical protein
MFIPKNTALIVQRIPGQRTRPILSAPIAESKPTDAAAAVAASVSTTTTNSSTTSTTTTTEKISSSSNNNNNSSSSLAFSSTSAATDVGGAASVAGLNEQERIQSLLADAGSNNYRPAPGERTHTRGGGGGGGQKRFNMRGDGSGVPPPAYTCHRCGQTGHYIQQCPTNADPQFTHKRVKTAIGIPTSALELVPLEDGATVPEGCHVMLINGKLAVYKPNEDAFKAALASAGVDQIDADLAPEFLVCPIDSKVLVDAVFLPCCDQRFCDACIRSSLLKKPRCAACGTAGMTPDLIAPDRERRRQVAAFMRGEPVVPPMPIATKQEVKKQEEPEKEVKEPKKEEKTAERVDRVERGERGERVERSSAPPPRRDHHPQQQHRRFEPPPSRFPFPSHHHQQQPPPQQQQFWNGPPPPHQQHPPPPRGGPMHHPPQMFNRGRGRFNPY